MKSHKKSCFSPIIERIEEIIRSTTSKGGEVEALHLFLSEMETPSSATKEDHKTLTQVLGKWRKSRLAPSKREREVQKQIEKLASGDSQAAGESEVPVEAEPAPSE